MRRVRVTSQLLQDGLRRTPTPVLPKLPTVGLRGWAIANAARLKCTAPAGSDPSSNPLNGSPTSMQRAVTPVSDGSVFAIPGLLEAQVGVTAVPLRNFVTPETCQLANRYLTTLTSAAGLGIS